MEVENFNQNDAELDPELLDFLIKSGQVKTAKDLNPPSATDPALFTHDVVLFAEEVLQMKLSDEQKFIMKMITEGSDRRIHLETEMSSVVPAVIMWLICMPMDNQVIYFIKPEVWQSFQGARDALMSQIWAYTKLVSEGPYKSLVSTLKFIENGAGVSKRNINKLFFKFIRDQADPHNLAGLFHERGYFFVQGDRLTEAWDVLIDSIMCNKDDKRIQISAPVRQLPWRSIVWPSFETEQLSYNIEVQGSEAEYRKQFTGEWLPEPETDDQES